MNGRLLTSAHVQHRSLYRSSVRRLGRFPLWRPFRRGRRLVLSSGGLARRLRFVFTASDPARTYLVFRDRIPQRAVCVHRLHRSYAGVNRSYRLRRSDHRRDHNAALLFCYCLAKTASVSVSSTGRKPIGRRCPNSFDVCPVMKIGFIAMSGLRLCNAELLELGLTFPGVARRKQAIEALPSLGLLTLAGMTPDDIDVEYLEVRDVNRDNLPADFDAVAISSLTATAKEAYALAARFRAIGTQVILGGLHV